MDTPKSMEKELSAFNNNAGIDLEGWISGMGSFSLAVGYATVFWPEFVEFEKYLLIKGFSEESLRGFEKAEGITRKSIESVMNHLHIAHIHVFCKDISKDKIILLGNTLKEIYEAKLKWQFPDRPCIVKFFLPQDEDDLDDYQISFWQMDNK